MAVDIRRYTRVIIRKNKLYLQGKSMIDGSLIWSNSKPMRTLSSKSPKDLLTEKLAA